MKNFEGTCKQASNLADVHEYLIKNKLKPIGILSTLTIDQIISGVHWRLSTARLANQVDALYLTVIGCPDEHMSVSEWTMFVCGLVTGEGLGEALCIPFVDDVINPRFVSVFIVRLDGNGKRTPFHSIDKLASVAKPASKPDLGGVH